MPDVAVLLCGGKGRRWNNYLGIPKHLIEIGDETLLERTVRLIHLRSNAQIVVVGHDRIPELAGTVVIPPEPYGDEPVETDKLLSARSRWSKAGRTFILYGDVWFSEECMDAVFANEEDFWWFGREGRSHFTGKRWGELFALAFESWRADHVREHIVKIRTLLAEGKISRGLGWEVYKSMVGIPLRIHATGEHFTEINDWTDDFDAPGEYEMWLSNRQRL